jgi:hypothetical protein
LKPGAFQAMGRAGFNLSRAAPPVAGELEEQALLVGVSEVDQVLPVAVQVENLKRAKFVTGFSLWVKGQARGLEPGGFKLWVKLSSACTAPHLVVRVVFAALLGDVRERVVEAVAGGGGGVVVGGGGSVVSVVSVVSVGGGGVSIGVVSVIVLGVAVQVVFENPNFEKPVFHFTGARVEQRQAPSKLWVHHWIQLVQPHLGSGVFAVVRGVGGGCLRVRPLGRHRAGPLGGGLLGGARDTRAVV